MVIQKVGTNFFFCLPPGFLPVARPTEQWWCCLRHLVLPFYVAHGWYVAGPRNWSPLYSSPWWGNNYRCAGFIVVSIGKLHGEIPMKPWLFIITCWKPDFNLLRHLAEARCKPGSPRPRTNKLDRSAMGPAFRDQFIKRLKNQDTLLKYIVLGHG